MSALLERGAGHGLHGGCLGYHNASIWWDVTERLARRWRPGLDVYAAGHDIRVGLLAADRADAAQALIRAGLEMEAGGSIARAVSREILLEVDPDAARRQDLRETLEALCEEHGEREFTDAVACALLARNRALECATEDEAADADARCRHCGGSGWDGDDPCHLCHGAGRPGGPVAHIAGASQ